MIKITTFDAVKMVVDEEIRSSANKASVKDEVMEKIQTVCEAIDELCEEFGGTSVSAEVEDKTKALIISMTCPEMVWEYGVTHPYFNLARHATTFGFGSADDELLAWFAFAHIFTYDE